MYLSLKDVVRRYYQNIQATDMTEKQYQNQQKKFVELLRIFGIDPDWIKFDGTYCIPEEYADFAVELLAEFKSPWVKEIRSKKFSLYSIEKAKARRETLLKMVEAVAKDDGKIKEYKKRSDATFPVDTYAKLYQSYAMLDKEGYLISHFTRDHFDGAICEKEIILFNTYIAKKLREMEKDISNMWNKINGEQNSDVI